MESFAVFADGTANLPKNYLSGIRLIPLEYLVDGEPKPYMGDVEQFDAKSYYEGLRQGKQVQTSLINTQTFLTYFASALEKGMDLIYVSMSSEISGTCQAAAIAARELMETYPGRYVHIVDSLGCGFGGGLLAIRAAELSAGRSGPGPGSWTGKCPTSASISRWTISISSSGPAACAE